MRPEELTPCFGRSAEFTSDDRRVLLTVAAECFACPIRVSCREQAEERGERFGVWGGRVFLRRPGPWSTRTKCGAGLHDLTGERAVYVSPSGSRQCRACMNARRRESSARARAARAKEVTA